MNVKKLLNNSAHPDKKFVERITELLTGPPDQWDREKMFSIMNERNVRLYGTKASEEEADWIKLGVTELLHNVEILVRLEKTIGSWLSFEECVVLSQVIYLRHFLYGDGFLINDPRDQGMTIGKSEGAALAACFHADPKVTYLDIEYGLRAKISDWNAIEGRIIQQILSDNNARLVEFDDLPSLND